MIASLISSSFPRPRQAVFVLDKMENQVGLNQPAIWYTLALKHQINRSNSHGCISVNDNNHWPSALNIKIFNNKWNFCSCFIAVVIVHGCIGVHNDNHDCHPCCKTDSNFVVLLWTFCIQGWPHVEVEGFVWKASQLDAQTGTGLSVVWMTTSDLQVWLDPLQHH